MERCRQPQSCRAFKSGSVALQVFDAVGVVPDIMLLEEPVELFAGLQAKQEAGLQGRERAASVPVNGESFQGFARRIGAHGEIVGKLDGDLHDLEGSRAGMGRRVELGTDSTTDLRRGYSAAAPPPLPRVAIQRAPAAALS